MSEAREADPVGWFHTFPTAAGEGSWKKEKRRVKKQANTIDKMKEKRSQSESSLV